MTDVDMASDRGAVAAAVEMAGVRAAPPVVRLLGVGFHAITEQECVDRILDESDAGSGGWVVTHNLDHVRRRLRDAAFGELCAGASLVVADGMPLIWACGIQGTPLPERVAGSNLISSLSAAAARRGRSLFFLGGNRGAAEAAARVLQAHYPTLRVAGTYCPAPGFEHRPSEMAGITNRLRQAAPDIVFVALGSPKQEELIERLRPLMPKVWWLGVGISFSFVSGEVKRAPRWMQVSGLEWVHRLVQEPRRLARRYLIDGLPFAARLMAHSAWARVHDARGATPG